MDEYRKIRAARYGSSDEPQDNFDVVSLPYPRAHEFNFYCLYKITKLKNDMAYWRYKRNEVVKHLRELRRKIREEREAKEE